MSRRRVLLATRPLVPPWDEASKNFAYFLGRSIQEHSLTLLTTREKLSGLPSTVSEEPVFSDKHLNLGAKLALFHYLRKARKDFDVTHYLFTPTKITTTLIQLLAKPTRGKTVQTIATLREDLYTPEELRATLFADHFTVYTDLTKEKLRALGFTNVTRIYPGIDLERFSPRPKSDAVLQHYHLKSDDFLVIYPGEFTRLGATDFLTEAFIEFYKNHPDSQVKFLFACRVKNEADRKKREAIRALIKQHGLENKILLDTESAFADMPALYNTADLVLFPVENLRGKFDVPLVIIEAYACAKPVILSDLQEFREFSNPNICVTIPKDSKAKLIESVAYLSQNTVECAKLGQAARTFVETHFDLKNTAKQYEELYSSL